MSNFVQMSMEIKVFWYAVVQYFGLYNQTTKMVKHIPFFRVRLITSCAMLFCRPAPPVQACFVHWIFCLREKKKGEIDQILGL
jgi:hypothetical protein